MVRIAITQVAYDAICATLPLGSVAVEPHINKRGSRYVWLEVAMVDRLAAMRGQGEDYSAVILRNCGSEIGRRQSARAMIAGITPGLYAVRLGGGTMSGATFRA
jgi:hypothetical protein